MSSYDASSIKERLGGRDVYYTKKEKEKLEQEQESDIRRRLREISYGEDTYTKAHNEELARRQREGISNTISAQELRLRQYQDAKNSKDFAKNSKYNSKNDNDDLYQYVNQRDKKKNKVEEKADKVADYLSDKGIVGWGISNAYNMFKTGIDALDGEITPTREKTSDNPLKDNITNFIKNPTQASFNMFSKENAYDSLTSDEVNTFNYIYETKGRDEAKNILKALEKAQSRERWMTPKQRQRHLQRRIL